MSGLDDRKRRLIAEAFGLPTTPQNGEVQPQTSTSERRRAIPTMPAGDVPRVNVGRGKRIYRDIPFFTADQLHQLSDYVTRGGDVSSWLHATPQY